MNIKDAMLVSVVQVLKCTKKLKFLSGAQCEHLIMINTWQNTRKTYCCAKPDVTLERLRKSLNKSLMNF